MLALYVLQPLTPPYPARPLTLAIKYAIYEGTKSVHGVFPHRTLAAPLELEEQSLHWFD